LNSLGTSSSVFPCDERALLLYYLQDPTLIVLRSTTLLFCSLMFCRQKKHNDEDFLFTAAPFNRLQERLEDRERCEMLFGKDA